MKNLNNQKKKAKFNNQSLVVIKFRIKKAMLNSKKVKSKLSNKINHSHVNKKKDF